MWACVCQKVPHQLRRGVECPAAVPKGQLLPVGLEAYTGQRVISAEVLRVDAHQKATIDISKDVKKGKVPLLMQWDKRWGYDAYGDAMIALSGCGPTCMTMAYLYHTGDTSMNPEKMAEYAQDNGYHTDEGTSWTFWTDGAAGLGLYGEEISLNESTIDAVLDCGGLVVCSMTPGDFTDTGHYILLRGYDSKGYFVNDQNRRSNSKKQWTFDTLSGQIKNLWAIYK